MSEHRPTCEMSGDNCVQLPDCPLAVCAVDGEDWPCAPAVEAGRQ